MTVYATDTSDRGNGLLLNAEAGVSVGGAPGSPGLLTLPVARLATSVPVPTLASGQPTPGWRDAVARIPGSDWGNYRLTIGGKNATQYRGVPATIVSYQLQEPYGYGPATFFLSQVTSIETLGTGELSWLDKGKTVTLAQVDDEGDYVRTIWRGFVSKPRPTLDGTTVECLGHASGRLSLRDKHPAIFTFTKDVGVWVFDAMKACGLRVTPHLGPHTGVSVNSVGRSGTQLTHVDGLLAETLQADGNQFTVMPTSGNAYSMHLKDVTTIHGSVFNGAPGVVVDVESDLAEEPTTYFGNGRDPEGQLWVNARVPGLVQGTAPPYPMTDGSSFSEGTTDADTDSGSGITDMIWKLVGMGFLDRPEAIGGYDGDVTDALEDLQDRAGLSVTGNMNPATWKALYDLSDTGLSLRQAHQAPLAQLSAVRRYNRTSNGSLSTRNPGFDPNRVQVDLTVDHGSGVYKQRAIRWSKRQLARVQNAPNWVGTITFTADLIAGDHGHGAGAPDGILSRLDITAGMNLKVRNFDGTTVFHVSGVNVTISENEITVACAVDTKARDLLTVGQIIKRNKQSRESAARTWLRERRGTDPNHAIVEWSEFGGRIFNTITCGGGQWTVFRVVAGQSGQVNRVRLQTSDDPAAYVVAISAAKVGPAFYRHWVGNPFDTNSHGESKWTNPGVQARMDERRILLGVWGDEAQPAGYAPRRHTNDANETTDAPITGLFVDSSGFEFHTFGQPVLYVAVYSKTDTKLKPQRAMWPVREAGT